MCPAQGPQRSDAGEARTCGLSVLSQVLNHWATALPLKVWQLFTTLNEFSMYNMYSLNP